MDDRYGLARFVLAQDSGGTYARALGELRAGRKESHWMWFIFPQIAGLGRSGMSMKYAISSLQEAQAYLAHPLLSRRLLECAGTVAALQSRDAQQVLGGTDARKLQSSMTLFLRAAPGEPVFSQVLDRYFEGRPDAATDRLLGR